MKILNWQFTILLALFLVLLIPSSSGNVEYGAPPVERKKVKRQKRIKKRIHRKKRLQQHYSPLGTNREKKENGFVLPPIWIPFLGISILFLLALGFFFWGGVAFALFGFWAAIILGLVLVAYIMLLLGLYLFPLFDLIPDFLLILGLGAIFFATLLTLGAIFSLGWLFLLGLIVVSILVVLIVITMIGFHDSI